MTGHGARIAVVMLMMGFAGSAPAQTVTGAVTSVVTRLDLDKCRHAKGTEPEDYGAWRCRGYGGIAVYVTAGDQRTYVSFGRNAKNEPAASETLAAFNGEGDAIEWRLAPDGRGKPKPFATIMRMSTTKSAEDPPVRGAMLVVTRLGPGGVCRVGLVDAKANADAEALARKIADERARRFKCGHHKLVIEGQKGPGFSGPYSE